MTYFIECDWNRSGARRSPSDAMFKLIIFNQISQNLWTYCDLYKEIKNAHKASGKINLMWLAFLSIALYTNIIWIKLLFLLSIYLLNIFTRDRLARVHPNQLYPWTGEKYPLTLCDFNCRLIIKGTLIIFNDLSRGAIIGNNHIKLNYILRFFIPFFKTNSIFQEFWKIWRFSTNSKKSKLIWLSYW